MKKEQFYEDLVSSVKKDFEIRQQLRQPYELAWQLNMNFVSGNQYCSGSPTGEIVEEDKDYFWQQKQVYNHIAPIVETRIARLNHVRPKMLVRPFSAESEDIESAKLATKILGSVSEKMEFDKLIIQATSWSEVCGTVFYKVTWDNSLGDVIYDKGKQYHNGDVNVTVCSPFEIYPDSNVASSVEECNSLIHAKAYSVEEIARIWGKKVVGEDIKVFSYNGTGLGGKGYNSSVPSITQETKHNQAIVIERYTLPNKDNPEGELAIVAKDTLLYLGKLPYTNGDQNTRGIPFIRQLSHTQVGCFWGVSIVDRLIPLQKSYNAVKNRKHEFLNRIAVGILAVEDGSVDTDSLETDGLSPGKVIVYRQGTQKPSLLDPGHVPADFSYEEDRLINEFITISGVSELARNSTTPTQVTSGTALQLLIEQDETRLSSSAQEIRNSIKQIGKYVLRMYKQFASVSRLAKSLTSQGSVELYYFTNSDLTSDDIVFETENKLTDSLANRRSIVTELLRAGVLQDHEGNLTEQAKLKILEMLGFGNWESAKDVASLHRQKAIKENLELKVGELPLEIDNHQIHIEEHVAYLISPENKDISKRKFDLVMEHINLHKQMEGENVREI
ncbi:MAG: hypothetical protein RR248_04070 [Clostridia bacterium]